MNKQRSFGVILQYIQMALNILIQLIYTPIMLRILGNNEYGIYNLASSTISYLSLLSLGFGASYLRYYSIYKKDNRDDDIKKLNGLYLLVFSIIGLVALISGLILTANVRIFYNDTYTNEEINIAKILMFFLTINLTISFPASVFVSYVTSQEKFVFQKLINMGKTVLTPAISIVLLYMGYGSIGMVITTTVISLFIDVINVWYCFKKLRMKVSFKNPNFGLLKDIFVFSIFIAINQIIDQINWQTDKIILGKMINGTAVAIYSVGASINNMYISFSTAVSNVFAPKVNRIVSENKEGMDKELTELFIKVGRIQWFVLALILSGFVFFGQFFILKWAGEDYGNSYYVALLLMAPAIIPLIQNIGIEIQRAKNKHKFRSIIYAIMAVLNVGISILFASMWGEIGTALGTTISLVVANGIIMNIYYQKKLGINVIEFWKSIIKTIPSFIIPIALGVLIKCLYNFHGIWDFILIILGYSIVFCASVYFLGLNNYEKGLIFGKIKKVIKNDKN